MQFFGGASLLGRRIFNRLGFVQYHYRPMTSQQSGQPDQAAIAGDHHVHLLEGFHLQRGQRPAGKRTRVRHQITQAGGKLGDFGLPIGNQRSGQYQ